MSEYVVLNHSQSARVQYQLMVLASYGLAHEQQSTTDSVKDRLQLIIIIIVIIVKNGSVIQCDRHHVWST